MKNPTLLIVTLFAVLAVSCKKEAYKPEFNASLDAWQKFKAYANNSYNYTTQSGSIWGFVDSTRITVVNGKVTNRDYIAYKIEYQPNNQPAVKTVSAKWNETAANLGSHQNGFYVYTMDQVYKKAKSDWLAADKSKNDLYFETKNGGILSLAGYVPKGCQDDCFVGVTITSVTKL